MASISPLLAVERRPFNSLSGVRHYVLAVFRKATKWPFGQRFDVVIEQGCSPCTGRDGPDLSRFDGWFRLVCRNDPHHGVLLSFGSGQRFSCSDRFGRDSGVG